MGLDITAYSRLAPVGKHAEGWCKDDDHVEAFAYDAFPDSFRGVPVLTAEQHGDTTFLVGGCYAITDETQEHRFQAGSYLDYGAWRSDLQRQFNPDRTPDGPFYELIWFADNEGSIGPDAARDLLADFQQHADTYNPPADRFDYSRRCYQDWTRACELAVDGGLICFH